MNDLENILRCPNCQRPLEDKWSVHGLLDCVKALGEAMLEVERDFEERGKVL